MDNLKISNFQDFLKYIKNSISVLKQINSKPIMGYVPPIPQLLVEKLIDLYIDEGINSFYFDLDGTLITSHLLQIDAIKRKLQERGYEENHFIHYINAKYGSTAINNTSIVPAQDIIGFIRGMDSFGGIHVGARRPPAYFEWLKKNKKIDENVIRIFDKEGYGYHKILSKKKEEINKIYPKDSIIPLKEIDFSKQSVVKRISEIVNMQQQILESKKISNQIHEEPKNTAKYFQDKKFLNKTILKKLLGKIKK